MRIDILCKPDGKGRCEGTMDNVREALERPGGLVIVELSSFQLERVAQMKAHVAVLLNVTPDHLDWHADEDEYRQAKYRIFREAEKAIDSVAHCLVHLRQALQVVGFSRLR